MDQNIKEIYTPAPLTVEVDASMNDCIELMRANRISCLIVIDAGKPIGIYTEADMVRTLGKVASHKELIIRDVMSSPVVTASEHINIFEATYILTANRIRHLIIVDGQGSLSGVITQTDIVAHYGGDYFLGVKSVKNVMTKNILTVSAASSVNEVVTKMEHYAAGCAIAVEGEKPIGILTERDIAGLIVNDVDIHHLTMQDVMAAPVITVGTQTSTYDTVKLMNERKVRRVVVVDEGETIVGILLQENIIRDLEGNYIHFLKQVLWDKDRNLEKAKAKFKEKSIHLENILHSTLGMGIIATDMEFNISYMNQDAERIYQINEKDSIGCSIDSVLSLEDYSRKSLVEIKATIANNNDVWFSHKHHAQEGVRQLESRFTVIQDEDNSVVGFTLLTNDVTERLKSEEKLLLASHVYDSAIEGIMVTGADGTIQSVNPAFTTITGYEADEVIGKNPRILQSSRQMPEFYQEMWDSILETGQWQGEIWNRRKNGETFPERMTISSVKDNEGNITQFIAVFYDITDIKAKEDKIQHQAYHDPLTELPNRMLFQDRLNQAIVRARRNGLRIVIMFIDIDNFKHLNDTLGHYAGDRYLQHVSKQLKSCLRDEDTVSRFGGDEFTVLIEENHSPQDAYLVAQKILKLLQIPYQIEEREVFLGASIGIAMYPDDASNAEVLLRNADMAMYHAKGNGKNNIQIFTPKMEASIKYRVSIESELRKAIDKDELEIHYQPIVNLSTKSICSVEALLRWNKPGEKTVMPSKFISLAEESGLIVPIGEWVIRESCSQANRWVSECDATHISVSVNLSARQFREKELIQTVEKILDESQLNPDQLNLEITESAMMDDMRCSIKTLTRFKDMGLRIYMDDFGTGHSSLTNLKKFPVDTLKLDHTFIQDIIVDEHATKLASGIISMAKNLNLEIIAEGVENEEQLAFLEQQGCDKVQGFFLYRPLPQSQINDVLRCPG